MPNSSSFQFSVIFICITIVSSCSKTSPDKTGNPDFNERANELYSLAITYSEDSLDQEKALLLYSEAFELYSEAGNRQRMASVYKRIGFAYDYLEDFEAEKLYLNKALEINKELENFAEQSIIYNFLGICHTISGNIDSALIHYNRGLRLSEKISDTLGFIDIYQNMGISYLYAGDYTEAIESNINALRYAEAAQLEKSILALTLNIAQLYYDTGDLDKAENYLNNSETLEINLDANPELLSLKGLINLKNGEVSDAYENFNHVLNIGQETGSKRIMAIAYINLAKIAVIDNRFMEAGSFATKSLELDKAIGNTSGVIASLIELAGIKSKTTGEASAFRILQQAEDLCKDNELNNLLPGIYRQFYLSHQYFGNYKQALAYYENYTSLKDSLTGVEIKEKIARLELSHKNERQQKEIELLDIENKINQQKVKIRNYFILSLILLLLTLLFLWLLYRQNAKRRFSEMEVELQKYIFKAENLSDDPDEPRINSDAFIEKYGLTQRETDVILLLSEGMSNANIAEKIFVSTNTVKYHMKNIYLKLDVKNRVEALNKVIT